MHSGAVWGLISNNPDSDWDHRGYPSNFSAKTVSVAVPKCQFGVTPQGGGSEEADELPLQQAILKIAEVGTTDAEVHPYKCCLQVST